MCIKPGMLQKAAGLVGRRRVLDSTPLYDAVATMDTVTLVRSAIRGLLKVADADRQTELRGLLARDDDYTAAGKPVCDYEDPTAREALVDALARDAMALVGALDGRELGPELDKAAQLLATVVGQDLDQRRRRGVPHRPPGRQGSGDLHGGPAGAARAQDLRARVRRLQGPPRRRPEFGDHHRHHGHRRQQRRRRPGRRPAG